ncbi:IS3 family transposase [Salmonella enterica]|nr:IS3 family transposase [Salmonella enterica]
MKRQKHTFEKRLAVVKHYFTTDDGYRVTAAKFNVPRTQVRLWTAVYENQGEEGLKPKPLGVSVDPEIRIQAVKAITEQNMSLNQVVGLFKLSGTGVLTRWMKIYAQHGEDGLRSIRMGKPRSPDMQDDPVKLAEAQEKSKDKRIEDLERKLKFMELKVLYPKKAEGLRSAREKTKVINELRQNYSINDLLSVADMPRSTFYYHLKAMFLPDKYAGTKKRITEIYHENKGRYGYRRITLALRREGDCINHKAVQRLMGCLSLKAAIKIKRYKSYKGEVGRIVKNVIQRDFKATKPNEKWVTDVTVFAVNGRKLYLSPVIDLFNNEVISYSASERPIMLMIDEMLDQCFLKLKAGESPVLHSDQGWQYQMRRYQNRLKEHGVIQSMSRKGNCLDNAVAESFFGTLKSECFYLEKFRSIEDLRSAIDEYIVYYNSQRISLKLKGLSPIEYRTQTFDPRV